MTFREGYIPLKQMVMHDVIDARRFKEEGRSVKTKPKRRSGGSILSHQGSKVKRCEAKDGCNDP